MSDIIRLLPDSVANQIAAGEVIQRPASVVKELVENAVDAGATDIRIFIKDAGRTLIQVVDNGKGMSETDARMAFERHATSKIRAAADLFTLSTMGFRGEALPSICAISQVELKTRSEGEQIGTHLCINASRVESQEPCACEQGANFMVKNIFFNVPARRKFLKSDNVELSNIMREFERLALVNNHLHMSIDTGTRVIDLRAGTFKQRIGDIWKNNLNMQLIPVEVDTSLVKINGFISRPEFARRRNPLQFLIVNGRNMRHPYFHKAIAGCFESLIAPDTQPCYFLKFQVDPDTIDVNIHPTKNEIKFEYEQQIWPILQAAVKAALGQFSAVPSIDFSTEMLPVEALRPGENPREPDLDIPADYNPFDVKAEIPGYPSSTRESGNFGSGSSFPGRRMATQKDDTSNWESLYSSFMHGSAVSADTASSVSMTPDVIQNSQKGLFGETEGGSASICLQYAGRYIVTPSREGLLVIDQHRAHVKILYTQYLNSAKRNAGAAQRVMFPETIELEPSQQEALGSVEEELARIGFILEYESGNRWQITAVPAIMPKSKPCDILLRILDSVCEDSANYGNEVSAVDNIMSRMALVAARASAIQRGQKLSQDEMEHLIGELFSLPDPAYTPNGNAIYCIIDENRLTSLFASH